METLVIENVVSKEQRFSESVYPKAKSFEEASKECNAVSVDEFFDELNARIEKWPNYA